MMSLPRDQSSAVESSNEIIESSSNSLPLNNVIDAAYKILSYSVILANLTLVKSMILVQEMVAVYLIHSRRKKTHAGIVPSSTGNLIFEDTNQGPNLSAGGANDEDDVAEPRMLAGSSSNIDQSVGVSSILGKDDISSGSKVSISDLADRTREVRGSSRQMFEVGSSSGPQLAENNLSNNLSVHLNDSSSHVNSQEYSFLRTSVGLHARSNVHPHPRGNIHPHPRDNIHPHPRDNIHPEMPQRNANPGLAMSSRQHPMLFNSLLASGNYPSHFVFYPSQSLLPTWPNDFIVSSRPSSSPDMSRVFFVPTSIGNLPVLPTNSNSRAGSATERRRLPDLRDLLRHPQHRSLAIGNYGAFDGASNHQMGYFSDYHQGPSLPRGPPSANQSGRQQTTLVYPPWFFSPWNGPGSGDWNFDFAPFPYPATNGHTTLADSWFLQHGHNNFGQNLYLSGPLISQPGHHLRWLGVPNTSQSEEAVVERDHSPMSEPLPQNMVNGLHAHQMYLQPQATFLPPAYYGHLTTFGYPEAMFLQDMHSDMRLEVDHMSYEELLALGEQIGNVRTGLKEETVMELLKRRYYECVNGDLFSDAETCCICREDYLHGEEVGELNCSHDFHTGCIKQWLVIKNACPICQVKGLGT